MESPICYGKLKYIVPVFIVMVESINRSGDGEGDMLIISYQYWPGRVINEGVVDGSNHFRIHHNIRKLWSKKIQRVVVWGVGCGGIGGTGRSGQSVGLGGVDIVEISNTFQWYEEGRNRRGVLGMGRIPTRFLYLSSRRLLPESRWWSITVVLLALRSYLLVALVPCDGFAIRSDVMSFFVTF